MRVLFVTNFHQLYGANRSLLSLLEFFSKQGDAVCVLIPKKGDFCDELQKQRIPYMVIPYFAQLFYYKHSLKYLAVPLLDFFTLLSLPFILFKTWRFKPDLVYSNCSAENLGIIIARILGLRHLSHIREFMDLDFGRYFLGGEKVKRWYISRSDLMIFVSNTVFKHVMLGKKLQQNQQVIYNGIRIPNVSFHKRHLGREINLGIVGLLDEGKGQDLAIKCLYQIKDYVPKAMLHIWGDKESYYKKQLYALINELGLKDRTVFHGFERNTDKIYQNMEVLLMCSKSEGFGRVTVEAMARGIPVIGYKSGGTVELIRHGYNGYMFESIHDFSLAFGLLTASESHYNEVAYHAYQDARERFDEAIYTRGVYNFIKEKVKS